MRRVRFPMQFCASGVVCLEVCEWMDVLMTGFQSTRL
jgi:hypothetical protein